MKTACDIPINPHTGETYFTIPADGWGTGWSAGRQSHDKRRARRAHRVTARRLLRSGTLLNTPAPVGSTTWYAAQWHLRRARWIGR